MLEEACEDELMKKASFYRWFKNFSKGNVQVDYEPGSGAPNSVHKKENIEYEG